MCVRVSVYERMRDYVLPMSGSFPHPSMQRLRQRSSWWLASYPARGHARLLWLCLRASKRCSGSNMNGGEVGLYLRALSSVVHVDQYINKHRPDTIFYFFIHIAIQLHLCTFWKDFNVGSDWLVSIY